MIQQSKYALTNCAISKLVRTDKYQRHKRPSLPVKLKIGTSAGRNTRTICHSHCIVNRIDGVAGSGCSVCFAVGRPGFIPLIESYQTTIKMVPTAFPLGARQLGEIQKIKPASSLAASLGKALNGTAPFLCGRQVAQTLGKWQHPSECGRPVQNIAIQFAFL